MHLMSVGRSAVLNGLSISIIIVVVPISCVPSLKAQTFKMYKIPTPSVNTSNTQGFRHSVAKVCTTYMYVPVLSKPLNV